jgi:hypothetical protein
MKAKVCTGAISFCVFLFMLVFLALWSSKLLTEWGSDFGVYYAGSYFISDDYRLYKELFDHKGPLYYLFLKMIGSFIGWGSSQAYWALFLTLLTFYIPAFLILQRQNLSPLLLLSGITLCLLLLFGQNTNSSIAFFQAAFLLMSFYLLAAVKNDSAFVCALTLFFLAVFVRIDALVFLPIYVLYAFHERGASNYKKIGGRLLLIPSVSLLIFFILSKTLDFDLLEFYEHNVVFNNWYRTESILGIFYRPNHLSLISSSLIIIPVYFLCHRIFSLIYENLKSAGKSWSPNVLGCQARVKLIYIGILFLAVVLWSASGSDKDYHLLVLTIPIVFVIISNAKYFPASGLWLVTFLALALYPLTLTLAQPLKVLIKEPQCISNPYCTSSDISRYIDSIDFLRRQNNAEVSIIGGRGWTYFYSDKKPARSLNDWWLYYRPDPFLTESLGYQHAKLLSGQLGNFFLVDNSLLDDLEKRSPLLKEILASSYLVEDQGRYSLFSLSSPR